MTEEQRVQIVQARLTGIKPEDISNTLNLPIGVVKQEYARISRRVKKGINMEVNELSKDGATYVGAVMKSTIGGIESFADNLEKRAERNELLSSKLQEGALMAADIALKKFSSLSSKEDADMSELERVTTILTKLQTAFFDKKDQIRVNIQQNFGEKQNRINLLKQIAGEDDD